jgi:hypothetical protein
VLHLSKTQKEEQPQKEQKYYSEKQNLETTYSEQKELNQDDLALSFSCRRSTPEKLSLSDNLKQLIAATPGYESLSSDELEVIKEGLLEFASISYSIFQRANPAEADEVSADESDSSFIANEKLDPKEKQKKKQPEQPDLMVAKTVKQKNISLT